MPADIRQRPGLLLGAAIVLHVGLISAQVSNASGLPLLQVVTFGAFAEVQRLSMNVVDGVRGIWTGYIGLREAHIENEALREQLRAMQVRLQEERALASRTEGLRQLLELRERAGLETAAAEVIAAAPHPDFRYITIDKGTDAGLQADQAVISAAGVVGRLILPSRRAAQVQLLIDGNAAVGAAIERSRAQGIVIGAGAGELHMQYVPGTADVNVGDLVVTSGIDGIYPKGFVIGTVESVDAGRGTYHDIVVRPAVDFTRLEEVLVVLTPPAAREAGDTVP